MGTYTTSGTGVTFTPNGGGSTTDSYCVQGDTLNLQSSASGAMMGMLPATNLVLTKR